jgi:hypothetical protein
MTEEKIKVLDDRFMEAEGVKNQIVQECNVFVDIFVDLQKKLKSAKGDDLVGVISKLKSFLDSGVNTMQSIKGNLREIAGDCSNIQKTLTNLGA